MNSPVKKVASQKQVQGRWLFWAVAAFLAVAAIATVIASKSSKAPTETASVKPLSVNISGQTLPSLGEPGTTDTAVGQASPIISGQDFAGTEQLVPKKDKRTMIVVVAHWCPHCQREIPRLVEWEKTGAVPADLDVVILSTSVVESRGNFPPEAWLTRENNPFRVLSDDDSSSAALALGNTGFPTMILVGSDGNVIQRMSGEHTIEEIAAFVQA